MAASLEGIHGQLVMPEMRREDAQRVRAEHANELAMMAEDGGLFATSSPSNPLGQRLCAAGIGVADDFDLGLREQPIEVETRRSTAPGDSDPHSFGLPVIRTALQLPVADVLDQACFSVPREPIRVPEPRFIPAICPAHVKSLTLVSRTEFDFLGRVSIPHRTRQLCHCR
jgi:hypothetical protein